MIWVRTEEGELALSLAEFESSVRTGRIAPSTLVRLPILTGERWVEARDLEVFWRLYEPARIYFARTFSLRGLPVVTLSLALVCVVVFLTSRQLDPRGDDFAAFGAKVPAAIFELGQTWRLFVANLLHRDPMHLFFNVLFLVNVGGTLENAYRHRDFAVVIVASALCTTLLSALMSEAPSVGASGVVLGLFGSASVFGQKYRDILPGRVKRYLLWAVLPYALFVLYVGLATEDTDNWGHLGGLLGGSLATVFLTPELLLVDGRRRFPSAAVLTGLVVVPLAAGPLIASSRPALVEFRDETTGLMVPYPESWVFGQDHLGLPAFGNALGATLGVSVVAESRPVRPEDMERMLLRELSVREDLGELSRVEIGDRVGFDRSGARGVEIDSSMHARSGPLRSHALAFARGRYGYLVVLTVPFVWERAYERVFRRIVDGLVLGEPLGLRRARARASAFPGMSSTHVELGEALSAVGDVDGASSAFQLALSALPEDPSALVGLARLSADYGGDLEAALRIVEELRKKRGFDPSLVSLLADIHLAAGRTEAARSTLEEALEANPNATELRERLRSLGPPPTSPGP